MARTQMNLNIDEEIRDLLKELCEKVKTPSGRPISLATAVTQWAKASKKAGYLLGIVDVDLTETLGVDELAGIKEEIANLKTEVATIKKALETPSEPHENAQEQSSNNNQPQLELIPRIYSHQEVAEITGLKVQTVKKSASAKNKTSPTILKHGFVKVDDGWKKE